jgi:hypothetical protein
MGIQVFGVNVGPVNVGATVSGSVGFSGGRPSVSVTGVGVTVGSPSSCKGVSLGPICLQ